MPSQISPLPPTPSLTEVCSTITMGESIHTSKTVVFFTIQRSPRISTSYKFAAPRYQLPCRLYRWASSPFNGMERSLSRAVIIKTKSLPISATTFRTALSLYIAHDGRKHKHNPTLSANKHVVQICRSSLSAAADGLANGSGERRTSPVNGIELKIAQSCRKVVPKSPLPRFQQRCLSTSHRDACERISAIQAVLKGRTMAIRKGNKHQLGLFFSLEACQRNACWVIHGSLTSERKASTSPSSFINHSTLLLNRALKRQAHCLYMHFEIQALDRLRTRRRVGSTRRRGNHMHDHSRFQRDINDVTGVSLSLSLPLTKVTDAQYRKRFRASYNNNTCLFVEIADQEAVGDRNLFCWQCLFQTIQRKWLKKKKKKREEIRSRPSISEQRKIPKTTSKKPAWLSMFCLKEAQNRGCIYCHRWQPEHYLEFG